APPRGCSTRRSPGSARATWRSRGRRRSRRRPCVPSRNRKSRGGRSSPWLADGELGADRLLVALAVLQALQEDLRLELELRPRRGPADEVLGLEGRLLVPLPAPVE